MFSLTINFTEIITEDIRLILLRQSISLQQDWQYFLDVPSAFRSISCLPEWKIGNKKNVQWVSRLIISSVLRRSYSSKCFFFRIGPIKSYFTRLCRLPQAVKQKGIYPMDIIARKVVRRLSHVDSVPQELKKERKDAENCVKNCSLEKSYIYFFLQNGH